MQDRKNLTNCSIPNCQFSSERSGKFPVRQPLRMRIENWELSNWSDPPPDSVSGETAELFLSEPLCASPLKPRPSAVATFFRRSAAREKLCPKKETRHYQYRSAKISQSGNC